MVKVTWDGRFHSVGQGLFHSARLELSSSTASRLLVFNCVYDCGASGPQLHVKREIGRFLELHTDGIEGLTLLMLSHLHWDHVSGLKNLLKGVSKTQTAILPYLYPAERAMILATATDEGDYPSDDSDWYLSFLKRPAEYLIENGVQKVIFVRGNDEEKLGEAGYSPDFPDYGEQLPHDSTLTNEPAPVEAGVRAEVEASEHEVGGDRLGPEVRLVTSGQPVGVALWQNVLFNRRPDEVKLRRFREEFDSLREGGTLASVLSDGSKLTALKCAYERIFGMRRMNETSMAVLSGITKRSHCRSGWQSITFRNSALARRPNQSDLPWDWLFGRTKKNEIVGIAFTGDLTVPEIWESLSAKFFFTDGPWRGRALFYQVPHHGSRHAWSTPQLDLTHPIYVISAGRANRYNHPHGEVLHDLIAQERAIGWVSELNSITYGFSAEIVSATDG